MSEISFHGTGELLFLTIDGQRVARQAVDCDEEGHTIVAWLTVEDNGYAGVNDIELVNELERKFQVWDDEQVKDEMKSMAEHFADYEDEISRKFAVYTAAQKKDGDLPH